MTLAAWSAGPVWPPVSESRNCWALLGSQSEPCVPKMLSTSAGRARPGHASSATCREATHARTLPQAGTILSAGR